MRQHVSVQVGSSNERLTANVALEQRVGTRVVLVRSMSFHMSTEIAALTEALFTYFTLVRFFC